MTPQQGFAPHVMTLGKGARRTLALHCTMGFGGAWKGFSNASPDLTLVAPDMPSHGRSADWDFASSFADTVFQASLDVMDDTPMDVIGHSFGAVIALRLAVMHPERVRSLTVIEPVIFSITQQDAPEVLAQHDIEAAPYQQALSDRDWEKAARIFNRMWSEKAPKWDDMPERNRAAMVRGVPVVGGQRAFLYDDAAGMLPRLGLLKMPVLVMRGAESHPSITAANNGLAARVSGSVQVAIPGAGHMAPITHPAEVAAEVSALMARC